MHAHQQGELAALPQCWAGALLITTDRPAHLGAEDAFDLAEAPAEAPAQAPAATSAEAAAPAASEDPAAAAARAKYEAGFAAPVEPPPGAKSFAKL